MQIRYPALQAVMLRAVKKIRNAHGSQRAGGFDGGESGLVVHDVIGEQDFVAAAAAHVAGGMKIERARGRHVGKKPGVALIPEPM